MLWEQNDMNPAELIIRYGFGMLFGSDVVMPLLVLLVTVLLSVLSPFCFVECMQLRGRSGRQGDPGSSRFFLSLEDNLFRVFGGDRIQVLFDSKHLFLLAGTVIYTGMIYRA